MATAAIDYTVQRSSRARRVRVTVEPLGEVRVVLPAGAPERLAADAVSELAPWIARRLERAERARSSLEARAGTVPYLGEPLRLEPQAGRSIVHRRGGTLLVPARDARPALERFYRRAARSEFAARLERASAASGARPSGLSVRAQRTRWGSCSSSGRISLNWRLMLAPSRVVDYVIWHEVCHLRVADHSPRFWRLLAQWQPTWREDRAWLAEHGATLTL